MAAKRGSEPEEFLRLASKRRLWRGKAADESAGVEISDRNTLGEDKR